MKTPNRHYLPHDEFRFIRMFLQRREIYFIAGTHSLFVPSRQEKYLMWSRPDGYQICQQWTDENGETYDMTPGEAARAELKKAFPGLRRVGWASQEVKLFDWRWPMMYTGPYEGEATYFDLKGAYHQIYKRLWLDTAFPCGYGSLPLAQIADNLKGWKMARNSIVGIIAARQSVAVKGTRTIKLSTQNPYLAPSLWATIQAILNELAFLAQCHNAIYIATDGYIFPERDDALAFEEILIDLGLLYRSSYGHSKINSWGNYKVKGKKTQAFDKDIQGRARPFCSIRVYDTEFPTRILRWWSKSIPNYSTRNYFNGGIKEWNKI